MAPTWQAIQQYLSKAEETPAEVNPVAVFAGGTSGIGEHTCYNFVQMVESPKIYIIGRNQIAGNRVMERIKQLNPSATTQFIRADLSLLTSADKTGDKILNTESKINLLFISAGFLSTSGYQETSEGIEQKLATHYLSRLKLVDKLMPLLETAASSPNETARVVTVLGAGTETQVDFDNLDLKKHSSIRINARYTPTLNTLAFNYLARQHPTVGFIHDCPGFVNTNISSGLPFYLRAMIRPFVPFFATSAEDSGKYHAYIATNPAYAKGLHLLDSRLNDTLPALKNKHPPILTDTASHNVWIFTKNVFNQVKDNQKYNGMPANLFAKS